VFSTTIRINFYDADPAGIMFYANIFKAAHTAYEDMLREGNFDRDYFFDEDYAIPILHADVDFHKPIFPGSIVGVEINVSTVKESSFELQYNFKNQEGESLARLKTVHVFIAKNNWEKTPIPTEFLKYLLTHLIQ